MEGKQMSRLVPKLFYIGNQQSGTIYTAPSAAGSYSIVKSINVANTSTATQVFSLNLVLAGETQGLSNVIVGNIVMSGANVFSYETSIVMPTGSTLQITQPNNDLTFTISGVEFEGSGVQNMSFQFLNAGRSGDIQQVTPIDTFIDPVSKIRVSNPSNLIDTDFEYGLQPTKWETVELINNTPAFFSKGGDTTIPDITSITTNAGTREITVTTAFPHNLDVGIPLRVAGTKSVTADGSYIINATPTDTTFTYLARGDQPETISIFDLYTSVITGEFFQGSQITISDAEGITTNGTEGDGAFSTLTVKTENKHGFGENTPFYFLNLNSTISQEFEAQNTASVAFDPTNSAAAQSFDGSNTLLQTPIDLSNSATTATATDTIQTTSPTNATFTVSIAQPNETSWNNLDFGDPLYYSVSAGAGYFQQNPRGVVFIKSVNEVNAAGGTATFEVSEVPNGDTIPVVANITGFFQIADQARTFPGNNVDEQSQIGLQVEVGQEFVFDGGNQGFDGEESDFAGSPPSNIAEVQGYLSENINLFTAEGTLDYYVGAMLKYEAPNGAATGLVDGETYFVTAFASGSSAGQFVMSVAELPEGDNISPSGGGAGQEFSKIGVSITKNIVHIKDSNFEESDMLEYTFPENGNFGADVEKIFYFVDAAFDIHNYRLNEDVGFRPIVATGGNFITKAYSEGRLWNVHAFTSTTNSEFTVSSLGSEGEDTEVDVLIVGGGGAGAGRHGAGGGAGGLVFVPGFNVSEQSYSVSVGSGGLGLIDTTATGSAQQGDNSTFGPITALGGGRAGFQSSGQGFGRPGGSGAGGNYDNTSNVIPGGAGQQPSQAGLSGAPYGFGNSGGSSRRTSGSAYPGGGGGGAGASGQSVVNGNGGIGGIGLSSVTIGGVSYSFAELFGSGFGQPSEYQRFFAGGGGGGVWQSNTPANGGLGGGGRGGTANTNISNGGDGIPNTGGGGGGAGGRTTGQSAGRGGNGGSGIVLVRYPITQVSNVFIDATGGNKSVIEVGNTTYAVHEFPSVGTSSLTINSLASVPENNFIEYLVIAGGGGGGSTHAGGGGAGGYRCSVAGEFSGGSISAEQFFVPNSTGNISVVVGNGGAGHPGGSNNSGRGSSGQNSSFGNIVATGGGGGGAGYNASAALQLGLTGGSGGGGGATQTSTNALPKAGGSAASPTQGFDGGTGFGNSSGSQTTGGGGGGAGQRGNDGNTGTPQPPRGNGGNGLTSSITGSSITRAGGGGGGGWNNNFVPIGGTGGGGTGTSNGAGSPGAANTGSGGGGGGGGWGRGGNGGSGIVIVRYPIGFEEQ